MDISSTSFCRFLYGVSTGVMRDPLTPEFDYRWDLFKSNHFQRSRDHRESTKRLIAQQLSIDGDVAEWVLDPRDLIKKANLTFIAKFFRMFSSSAYIQ